MYCGYSLVPTIYVEQKYKNGKTKSTENCYFYSREKSLYISWACFRNDTLRSRKAAPFLRGDMYLDNEYFSISMYLQKSFNGTACQIS